MDLIKLFPDVSMKEREKFRLRQKLYPKRNSNSQPSYEKDKYLLHSYSHEFKKNIKLLFIVLISLAIAYIVLISVPEFFKWTTQ